MISLADVLSGTGGVLASASPGDPQALAFHGVQIDSRSITPGDLFVAIRGEMHDGHRFVPDASARGAAGALIARCRASELAPLVAQMTLIEVDDTLMALGALAAYWRARFTIPVVGITGSIGKSSTKELAAGLLGTRLRVLKSPKSYNNEYGLPLSVLLLDEQTDIAVLEMGTFGPGELTALAAIARPTVAVVTNVGHSHLERMGSQSAIAAAKGELVAALPAGGTAILNGDDPLVRAMADRAGEATVCTYGLEAGNDLRATECADHGLDGLSFALLWQGERRFVDHAPLLGAHSRYTALAAAAIALTAGFTLDQVVEALRVPHPAMRLLIVPGRHGETIIDDSYNAAPASVQAALAILARTPARRRVAVLGDMLELGAYTEEAHRIVGRRVAAVADAVLTIGSLARLIADEAAKSGLPPERITALDTKEEALATLVGALGPGDVVLIKGSRGLALETVVAALREGA